MTTMTAHDKQITNQDKLTTLRLEVKASKLRCDSILVLKMENGWTIRGSCNHNFHAKQVKSMPSFSHQFIQLTQMTQLHTELANVITTC